MQAFRCDLDDDPVDSYLEHLKNLNPQSLEHLTAISKNRTDPDYNSDEEVYATARAIAKIERDREHLKDGIAFDGEDNPIVKSKREKVMELLPPVNHDKISYPSFEKVGSLNAAVKARFVCCLW